MKRKGLSDNDSGYSLEVQSEPERRVNYRHSRAEKSSNADESKSEPKIGMTNKSSSSTLEAVDNENLNKYIKLDEPAEDIKINVCRNLSILIVEDSNVQSRCMAHSLSLMCENWKIDIVVSAHDAIAKMNECQYSYDLIFVDEVLPSFDSSFLGHELILHIREKQMTSFHKSAIVACTSDTLQYSKNLLDSGADAVWGKPWPLSQSQMKDVIKDLLKAHKGESHKANSSISVASNINNHEN